MGTRVEARGAASAKPRLPERYEPIRPIAAGGSALVWCAEDRLLGRRVAVKLLAEPYASDPAAVRRFKREARAAARLSAHPHVVTIFDVGEVEDSEPGQGQPFIVMEYLAGGTVGDALRLGEVTLDEAVRWLQEAASAIDYAHAKGILHRDIKPANLLLDPRRVLHVADFGIAQIGHETQVGHEDPLTLSGQVLGTASYLAPERALGQPATMASDLYSLAIAAFELLTGERPFTASSYVAQARQHLEREPPRASERNPRLPPAVDAALARGMAKRPEDRWPSAETFAAAIERALAPSADPLATRAAAISRGRRAAAARATAVHAAPEPRVRPSAPSPPPPRERRLPLGHLAGAVASLVVLVAAVAWATSGGGSKQARSVVAAGSPASTAPTHPAPTVRHAQTHPRTPTQTASTPTLTAARAATTTPVPTADTLAAQGHALINAGNYAAAIRVLERAVTAASPASLTYAYSLYDLGHALLLAGDPQDAVPVLLRRMQIPNQTDIVRAQLTQALQEIGAQSTGAPTGGAAPLGPPGHKPDHHGHGPGGGSTGN